MAVGIYGRTKEGLYRYSRVFIEIASGDIIAIAKCGERLEDGT
jgi:hypothetical protein